MKFLLFVSKLVGATMVALVFSIVEVTCAIPCALKDYFVDHVIPSYKSIWNDYFND